MEGIASAPAGSCGKPGRRRPAARATQAFLDAAKAKPFSRLQPNMLHPVPMTAVTTIAEGRFAVFHPTRDPAAQRGIGIPAVDIGICGTNIVLAAQSYGLGNCWIGLRSS